MEYFTGTWEWDTADNFLNEKAADGWRVRYIRATKGTDGEMTAFFLLERDEG